MSESLQKKSDAIKKNFASLSKQQHYDLLFQMGQQLPPFPSLLKIESSIVPGCQSTLYLHATSCDGRISFVAHSEALISAGLAALLVSLYSGESPETVLTSPPVVIEELQLTSNLSLNRSNGLANIYLRMKQLALAFLIKQ